VDVFAAALGDILADPHVGVDAAWRQGGTGEPVPVRVVRSSPDRVASAFDVAVIQATDVLTVAVADVPDLAAGDSVTVGPDVLIVTHAERDGFPARSRAGVPAIGVAWRVYCRREP
jgi:hypothetical protein